MTPTRSLRAEARRDALQGLALGGMVAGLALAAIVTVARLAPPPPPRPDLPRVGQVLHSGPDSVLVATPTYHHAGLVYALLAGVRGTALVGTAPAAVDCAGQVLEVLRQPTELYRWHRDGAGIFDLIGQALCPPTNLTQGEMEWPKTI